MPRPSTPDSWGDASTKLQVDYVTANDAAWVLTRSALWPLVSGRGGMVVFGLALFLLIACIVLLSPATDSHFIYTDF
jgi:hypothetical protein